MVIGLKQIFIQISWHDFAVAPGKSPDMSNSCSCTRGIDIFSPVRGPLFMDILTGRDRFYGRFYGRVITIRTTIRITGLWESFTDTEYCLFLRLLQC